MLHVLGCITGQHDIRLVVLAAALYLFACATAMTVIARGRAVAGFARSAWSLAAGVVAGWGIWGLHFVAMLAYRPGLPVAYDAPPDRRCHQTVRTPGGRVTVARKITQWCSMLVPIDPDWARAVR